MKNVVTKETCLGKYLTVLEYIKNAAQDNQAKPTPCSVKYFLINNKLFVKL